MAGDHQCVAALPLVLSDPSLPTGWEAKGGLEGGRGVGALSAHECPRGPPPPPQNPS